MKQDNDVMTLPGLNLGKGMRYRNFF